MNHLAEFHEHLKRSRRIVALVGAGLLALSGLPTFRGTQGLWKNFNMIDLATPDAFYIDPGLVWQFYSWRRINALKAQPNRGHKALAALSRLCAGQGIQFITINQNVDGLLVRAGHDTSTLHQIHGLLFDLRCTGFACNYVDRDNFEVPLTKALDEEFEYSSGHRKRALDEEGHIELPQFTPVKQLDEAELPQCPVCADGTLLRPGVVWFGESLPLQTIDAIDNFIEAAPVDLVLVIGTSGTVYPANSYVERIKQKGGRVAVFNTEIEDGADNVWRFRGDAEHWLPLALAPLIGDG